MKKAQIRMAVALAMSENGYSEGNYGWSKPGWLSVFDGVQVHKIHLPAVKTFKVETFIERMSVLSPIGPPREAAMPIKLPKEIQIDLVDWINNQRSTAPSHAIEVPA